MESNLAPVAAPHHRTLDFMPTPLVVASPEEIQLAEDLRRRIEQRYLKVMPRLSKWPAAWAPSFR